MQHGWSTLPQISLNQSQSPGLGLFDQVSFQVRVQGVLINFLEAEIERATQPPYIFLNKDFIL